jgi:hypothetical protein
MMANFDRLIDGAAQAARVSATGFAESRTGPADQLRAQTAPPAAHEEEVEAVGEVLPQTLLAGFTVRRDLRSMPAPAANCTIKP